MDCIKCKRKSIKYRCIGCKIPICNVCSVACSTETPGYSEETYLVGKCDDCFQVSSRKRSFSEHSSSGKPRQSTLSSILNVKLSKTSGKRVESEPRRPKAAANLEEETASTSMASVSAKSTKKARSLSVTAANRWKTTALVAHSGNEWLVVNGDKAGCVSSLNCSVCKTYAEKVKNMKNFSTAWAFSGSTNLRVSNAKDHARGEPHKRAMDLHFKELKGLCVIERAEAMKGTNDAGQQLITTGIANMQAGELATTKIKFEVAYFIAKEELPLAKYEQIVQLEEKHGVEIGKAYRNRKSCAKFISSIGDHLAKDLENKLSNANFFSVLTDSSEDTSITEKEAVFVQYLDKRPPGRDTIQVATAFLRLVDVKYGTAAGIVDSIKSSFESINITDDLDKKLIGFAGDGATVNRGEKEGVIALLKRDHPWIIYVWCVAHRLELALKDALKGTCFDSVDEVLLRLYYLYENSPKKLRQLHDLHNLYRQTFEFEEGAIRTKRACGKLYFFEFPV